MEPTLNDATIYIVQYGYYRETAFWTPEPAQTRVNIINDIAPGVNARVVVREPGQMKLSDAYPGKWLDADVPDDPLGNTYVYVEDLAE